MKLGLWVPSHSESVHCNLLMQGNRDVAACIQGGHSYDAWWGSSSDLVMMRNAALEKALEKDLDYLMMQDSDIYCPCSYSPLMHLVQIALDNEATVTAAVCGLRRIEKDRVQANVYPYAGNRVLEVDAIGTGVILIDIHQIRQMREEYDGPWFARTYNDAQQTEQDTGLDVFFCKLVRGLGGKVVAAGDLPTVHVYQDHLHLRHPGKQS